MRASSALLLLGFGLTSAGAAFADDDEIEFASTPRSAILGAGSNDVPRLIRNESFPEAQRALPGYRNETTELGYRWWMSTGRVDLGLGLGSLTYGTRPTGSLPGLGSEGASSVLASGTVMTVGMRYRSTPTSTLYADASGVRGHGFDGGEAVVGKVGIEFKAAQSRFNINYGGLGLRLAGDTRMTLRVKRGGLGIFMRSAF
ncbi:MAG: hypothetical protein ABI781_04325 [Burkholderiales bacterium]